MNNITVRTITGAFFVAIIVTCFLDPLAMIAIFALVTGLTTHEFCTLINNNVEKVQINTFICTVAGVYFFFAMAAYGCGFVSSAAVYVPYLITIIYLLVAELYLKAENPINNWAYTMLSQMYIALPFSMINVLAFQAPLPSDGAMANPDSYGPIFNNILPLSIFIFLWLNDSGAYCTGSLFGKHKLFPRISPAKSWEGSIGGGLFVILAAWGIYTLLSDMEELAPYISQYSVWEFIGLGIVVVVFGTWGDLVESLFKRTIGIKDSGKILPGHGGMLDRFDSSLLAFPAAVVYLFTIQQF